MRSRWLLLAGTVFLTIAACEIFLRFVMAPGTALLYSSGSEAFFRYIWLTHRTTTDSSEQFTHANPRLKHDPLLGWRPRENYRPTAGLNPGFFLNARGVRSTRDYDYLRAPGERRIVVMGDSFTFASFDVRLMPAIPAETVYTTRLESMLPGVSVINLGVDGYGTDQMYLYLKEEGLRYDPDLVVVSIFYDDLERSLLSFRDYAKPRFRIVNGELVLTGTPVPPPQEVQRQPSPRVPRLFLWARASKALRDCCSSQPRMHDLEMDQLNEAILDALHDDVRKRGAGLLIVIIPKLDFTTRSYRSEEFLRSWGARRGVRVLSLREKFLTLDRGVQGQLYEDRTGHWTPLGHEEAAKAIHGEILANKLLPGALFRGGGSAVLAADDSR